MDDLGASSARRMLVYFLIDTSSSMHGTPIQAVREGVEFLNRELRRTPEAIELVHICIITFDSQAQIIQPLVPLVQFKPDVSRIIARGSTNMTHALQMVNDEIDRTFRMNTGEIKGDFKPAIFLLTDGAPNDRNSAIRAGEQIKNRPSGKTVGTFLGLGCGPHVDVEFLRAIAKNVALMQDMSGENIQEFFKWVTASLSTASKQASRSAAGQEVRPSPEPIPQNSQGNQAFTFDF